MIIKCKICGEFFNPALLSQVCEHEHKGISLEKEYYGKEIMECRACHGTGEEREYCCKNLSIAILNHCACKGQPQFKADCPDCSGTGKLNFIIPTSKQRERQRAEKEMRGEHNTAHLHGYPED